MTEEEYFRKNYPDSCYGDRLLSPHWDFFQAGVEFGERQSEKKIATLEKEIAELKKTYRKQRNKRIDELQKENAELKADNDARKFAMTMSEKVEKQLREENAELKTDMATAIPLLERAKEISESLTKAKELLKEFIFLLHNPRTALDTKTVMDEAEQFLSEVEK